MNNQLMIDRWTPPADLQSRSAPVSLKAGEKANVRVEYYDSSGKAIIHLLWGSASTPKQIIPQRYLYPEATTDKSAQSDTNKQTGLLLPPGADDGPKAILPQPSGRLAVTLQRAGLALLMVCGLLALLLRVGCKETAMFTRRAINYLYNYGAYVVSFTNYVRSIAAYIRSEKNSPVVRRFICWIICLGLLVSNTPVSPAMAGRGPSKSKARLIHQPPERNLPYLDRARRMTPGVPKMLSQVPAGNKPVKKNNRVVELLTNVMSFAWPGLFFASGMSGPSDLASGADKVRGEAGNTFTSPPSRNKSAAIATASVGRGKSANTASPMFQGDDNWPMAMLAPTNRVGWGGGEDLLSRNYNWTLPLISLPGRAGLNLNLSLSLNSLIWTKSGGNIHFNKADGFPSPGFHLGFPELKTYFYNSEAGVGSRLVIMPSGKSFEFWENAALQNGLDYIYEERNGSNMIIVETLGLFDPNETVWTLLTPDGTAYKYVVVGSNPKCVEIKDRNGNYISVAYNTSTEKITRITDTLNREVNFNYDGNNRLTSITQNWGGMAHTWATFAYSTVTISAGFLSLNMVGAQNGQTIPVLSHVGLADGSIHSFEYNTYGQAHTIRRYAPNTLTPGSFPGDYTQLSYVTYDLPRDGSGQQNDCPRFNTRKDWAHDWNNDDEVPTSFAGDLSSWGSVTTLDNVIYKEFYGAGGSWQRGLTTRTETWLGQAMKKWTTLEWTQDNTGLAYPLNPRLRETNVYDDANNRRRVRMSHTSYGLVSDVYEYDANATTVLRHTHTDYNLSGVYTSRRIIGLPSAVYLKDGNDALFSKVTYEYDLNPNPNPYLEHPGQTARHDTANYGPGFVEGRGNLNRMLRWDVTDPTIESKASEYETGYNTSGSVIFTRDPLNHETTVSYTDSFSDEQNRNTHAYPTRVTVTDPDPIPSTVQYDYYFGAVTRTQDPKGAAVARTYDAVGRLERTTNEVNGAYTKYVYAPDQRQVESFTTINDLNPANEFRSITVFDGHGRALGTASDHPTSVGGHKAQLYEYDIMGRRARQTNPTEIDNPTEIPANWAPAGDDATAGWVWSSQAYDWQNRPTVTTNQDTTTKEILYGGCGCAGGQVVVTRDEVGRRQKMTYDIIGRLKTTQELFIQPKNQPLDGNGAVYSTTTNTYNVRDQVINVNVRDEASGVSQNTQMVYDGHGRLKERWLPIYLGNPQSATPYDNYEYNSDDTLMRMTDPRGASATYGYNNRRMVTSIVYSAPGGVAATPNVTFAYDNVGNRTWMDDGLGYVSYVYDTLSRLQSETRHFDDLTGDYQISYTYNLAGQIGTITDNRFSRTATYTYNKAGELTGVTGSGYGSAQNNFTASNASITYRTWGAAKQVNYGSGLQLNLNYNERLQPVQYRLQTGQSQVVDGSNYQYYDDGRVKFASNLVAESPSITPANAFDRSYSYDHVGRLAEAATGPEARGEVLPPSPPIPNNPYKQVNTYDVWGNLTSRINRFWRMHPSDGGAYSNNRRQGWSYDMAGNVLINTTINSYDTSGHNVLSRSNLYVVGGGLTGHPSQSAFEITQGYDGDGFSAKRVETKRTEEFVLGGPETEISTVVATTYYVRSSALGGQVALEIESIGGPNLNMAVHKSHVYAGNERMAEYTDEFGGGPSSITWKHSNPVTGTMLRVLSGGSIHRAEFDPFGAEVGNADPYFGSEIPTYLDMKGEEPLYIDGGDPFDLSGGCALDGMPVACSFAMGSGNEEAAARVPGGEERRFNKDGRLEYFTAFANGTQGYILHDYDPEEDEPPTLYRARNVFSFQAQQQKKRELPIERKKVKRPATPTCTITLSSRGLNYPLMQKAFHHMFITTQTTSTDQNIHQSIPTVFQGIHPDKHLRVQEAEFKAGNEDYDHSRNPGAISVPFTFNGTCDEANGRLGAAKDKINAANIVYGFPILTADEVYGPHLNPNNSNAAAYTLLQLLNPEWRVILEKKYRDKSGRPFTIFTPGWGTLLAKP